MVQAMLTMPPYLRMMYDFRLSWAMFTMFRTILTDKHTTLFENNKNVFVCRGDGVYIRNNHCISSTDTSV